MFTGLVEALGTVLCLDTGGPGRILQIAEPVLAPALAVGDSVAVNGVCLTVVVHDPERFAFEIGPETLRRTNLGDLVAGDRVNLERPLRLGDRLDGHLVQGHVDGTASVAERVRQGEWEAVSFICPSDLTEQMVPRGAVAVDGVSLTLVEVSSDRFRVALIPHTLANTTLGIRPRGAKVNVETDLFAKYAQKYIGQAAYRGG